MNAVYLDSFAQLRAMMDGQLALSASTFAEPAFERLRSALATPCRRSPLDLAALFRHTLAHENGRRGSDNDAPCGSQCEVVGRDRQNGGR